MKADRLLSILLLLQTRGRVSATELADRLEVSVRTIYRDVEALSASGVPVYTERGRHGGIALLPGYRTDVSGLTSDEARALFVLSAQCVHSDLGLDGALGSALRKVMAALPAPHRPAAERISERVLVDPARWLQPGSAAAGTDLGELQHAVFADRRLRLRYRHSGTPAPVEYTVDPYGLVFKASVWYLVADLHGEPRLFRAERVLAAETAEEPVRRRPGVGLGEAWAVLREQVERLPKELAVKVRVRRGRLDMFVRIHGSRLSAPPPADAGGGAPEEWVELAMGFQSLPSVRALLSFGGDAEVVSPQAARRELARAAAEAARLYRD
ncbi:WYL domain-containing protein [Streptomyces sp. CB01881]|uniref:helix-turn-helix transcriptional regulator n=1 Tax=Streptomyces sp. CB01881 TaxID=2078691 RepID=UPI000CDC4915|nr:WYL domain-containing protein [Streptomyces sp. CB01881]AUY51892.1 DNA-binding transcriptional regulator [Streptomyces sp. CB01881]TYC71320.1 WYL domain-containing protein [Streptomyces sp. CB01881]